ncbi:serine protease PepD [Amycolatopsis mediterranei S699]|uniref:Serine protease PepD n=2 Tax=Amycolatopsis mediterranei TaxID=33910 RepID=A0A9R0P3T1_AMYMS|nr:trypsin-like peptidase domain-containing protein [Amycolatopsis mediterranei]ADJ48797.1 putative serine protease PepD [Amycolatopsis mediterranei U32]AEK45737.1 serine protease PepD [Amycolatopsis mediterranei S699]AFO80506.1 serine protease PepD [Amycolatopsis mediterranei S699]AGT87634.1 serine protease PepD [Amycolatopsis mediterranei RB]KDO04014.1 serine protease [Amycolatopsis mediterranei]
MTENESRPGPASTGGHQPHQSTQQYGPYAQYGHQQQAAPNPLFTPQQPDAQAPTALKTKPRKGGRVAMIVSATALGAALVGGVGGAAIVGLTTTSADGATTSISTPAANGQTVANSTSGDVSAVAAKVTPSVVQINVTTGQGEAIGSGVILTSDGRILTNAHVVDGAQNVVITTSDGKKYQASVVGADTKADIAVVQAKNASGLTAASLGDSSKLAVGQEVVAIGSPGGLQNTVTTGIVSALNRNLSDIGQGEQQRSPFSRTSNQSSDSPSYTAIQTDAAINQGNSGGALVDAQGNVIGINSALYSPSASANGSAGSVGIGFAIPINDAKKIVDQIVSN